MSSEVDLRTYLSTAGISGLSTSNCFIGPQRKPGNGVPAKSVWILEMSSGMPYEYMNGASEPYRFTTCQVRIRSDRNGYIAGKELADAVWVACQKVSSASVSSASRAYVRVFCEQSSPLYWGVQDDETEMFSMHVRMEHQG